MLTEVLDKLVSGAPETRELRAGELLFRQGDKASHIFAVDEGEIRLARCLSSGKSVVMHVAHAGHAFTEAALFSDIYHCDAVAGGKARVRAYKKKEILAAIAQEPTLALDYIRSLSREVQRLRLQLELHNIASARERIMQFLLLEADPQSLEFEVRTSLKDVAATLGLAHETFYRELGRLENDGVIARAEKRIRILKIPGL